MRSLRILQIVPSLALETGGPTTSVPGMGITLGELGHRVILYTTTWPVCGKEIKSFCYLQQDPIYHIETFPAVENPLFPNLPYSPALVNSVLQHSNEFDLVHVFSLWNPVATFSLRALRKNHSPYCLSPLGMMDPVVIRRNRLRKAAWKLLWEGANIEQAALVQFTTAFEENRARGLFRLNRTVIIPHVVKVENWESLPNRSILECRFPQVKGREVILFVGRINWVKNLDLLLKALVYVRDKRRNAMLVFVGPDNEGYQSVLREQAHDLGLDRDVVFTGMLNGDMLKAAYARADAFALVSQKENFGHTAAEALACGIPLVVSKEVGVSASWPQCDAVFRVESRVEEIAPALIRALERSASVGLPDPEARSLSRKVFDRSEGPRFSEAYSSVVSEHTRFNPASR